MASLSPIRLLAVVAVVSLAIGALACGGEDDEGGAASGGRADEGAKDLALTGKSSVLTFDKDAVAVLQQKKVQVAPVGPAAPGAAAGTIRFPITGGSVDPKTLAGSIAHSGGLKLSVGGQTLEATDFIADTESGVLTATAGAAEIPLLKLDLGGVRKSTKNGAIVASGISTALTPLAAAAMNGILGVSFFKGGLALGTLTVTATAGG